MAAMAAFTFSSCEDVPAPYTMPEKPETPGTGDAGTPEGTGTATDPFNIAGAIKYIEDGGSSTAEMYVKGKVVSVNAGSYDANYGSLKYYISDDGTSNNQFYVYNGYAGPNRTKFTGEDALKAGDEVVICGQLIEYSGTKEFQTGNYIVTLNGNPIGGGTPDTPTTGKGSESDPYTVAEAIETIKAGAPTTEVYLTGIISDVAFYNEQYKSITYYISDDGKSKDMQVYSGKGLNGKDFASKDELKVGQKVTILGKIMKFTDKNGNEIMEVDKTSSIIKIEDGGSTPSTPDTPATGENEISISNMVSSVALPENSYGSQATATESTWFTWKSGNISYAGAKICKATEANGGGIQIQGNASDATKQGFFFNKTAFSNDIKSITIVVRGSNKYDTPTTFSVYEGTAAHPTGNKIEGKYTTKADGDFNVFTMTYDFSAVSSKYFTVWNNAVGALYIDKVIITLK